MKHHFIKLFFLIALVSAAGAVTQTSAQTVKGSIANGVIKRGGSARATIVLDIPAGLHANSSRPGNADLIATVVRASSKEAKVGAVMYPRGVNRRFAFQDSSDKPLNVYQGRTAFNFNVAVPASFKGNTVKIRVVVSYQTCNEEACFPPRKQELTLTARVK